MNHLFLVKKLGHQELGSRGDHSQTAKRGQYLYVYKALIPHFPPLDLKIKNTHAPVPLYPLYLKNKLVYGVLVYHNDKFFKSTAENPRNEFRLYSGLEVQGGQHLFEENGFLIFRSVDSKDPQTGFFLDYIPPGSLASSRHKGYQKLIDAFEAQNGNFVKIHTSCPQFETSIRKAFPGGYLSATPLVSDALQKIQKLEKDTVPGTYSDSQFRDLILGMYGGRCAITGKVISHEGLNNLEAAHIKAEAYGGQSRLDNGLPLSQDLHWAFDCGFFTLTDDYKVLVSPKVLAQPAETFEPLAGLNGGQIRSPNKDMPKPNLEFIRFHRDHIFEKFKPIKNSPKTSSAQVAGSCHS